MAITPMANTETLTPMANSETLTHSPRRYRLWPSLPSLAVKHLLTHHRGIGCGYHP